MKACGIRRNSSSKPQWWRSSLLFSRMLWSPLSLPLMADMLFSFLTPVSAQQYPLLEGTVNVVGNQLPPLFSVATLCDFQGGACGFVAIALAILIRFRPLLTTIAFLTISITG